jgi:hypothetical protein
MWSNKVRILRVFHFPRFPRVLAFKIFWAWGKIVSMIDTQNTKRRYNWKPLPKEAGRGTRWSSMYVTLSPLGWIWLSRLTHETMGSPDSYVIVYDEEMNILGLQAARLNVTKNAYPASPRGKHGGMRIYAHRLIREFNLYLNETAMFPRCFIDHAGTLILDLNDVRPATRKRKKKYGG